MRTARLRHVGACPEDVDYRARRGLDKTLFKELLAGKWIADKRNLIITGHCGVAKTWLACALTQAACRNGITALYKRLPRLFDELELAHGDGVAIVSRTDGVPMATPQVVPQSDQNPVAHPQ